MSAQTPGRPSRLGVGLRVPRVYFPAAKEVGFNVPVVVRLEDTSVERARQLLAEAL